MKKTVLFALLSTLLLVGATSSAHAAVECRPSATDANNDGIPDALPGDGIPDNAVVQAAFDACGATGGDVVIDQVFDLGSRWAQPIGNPWRFFSVVVTANAKPFTIRAENGGGFRAVGNWYGGTGYLVGVYKNAAPVVFRDLYLDMSARCEGIDETVQNCRDEQQHAVQLDIGSQNIILDHLVIFHPSLGPNAGGDCIRMLGGDGVVSGNVDAELVRNITIHNFVPLVCDRSAIGFQRSVRNVLVDQLISVGNTDNDLDMEATGVDPNNEDTWIQDVTIRNALISKNGGNAITTGRGIRLRVEDSTILGGGIFSVSCRDCLIANSTLIQNATSGDAPIGMIRSNERTRIMGNRLGRMVGATSTDALIYVVSNNGFYPKDTLIMGNSFAQIYSAPAIRVENADATITDNTFRYEGAAPATGNAVGINVRSLAGTLVRASVIVQGNRFVGAWDVAVSVSGVATGLIGAIVVNGNVFEGAKTALRCANWALAYPVPPVRTGNWKPPTVLDDCPIAVTGY